MYKYNLPVCIAYIILLLYRAQLLLYNIIEELRDDDDVCSRLGRHNYLLIQLDRGRFSVSRYSPRSRFSLFVHTIFPPRLTRSLGQSLLNQTRAKTIINQRRTRWRRSFPPLYSDNAHARVNPLVSDTTAFRQFYSFFIFSWSVQYNRNDNMGGKNICLDTLYEQACINCNDLGSSLWSGPTAVE